MRPEESLILFVKIIVALFVSYHMFFWLTKLTKRAIARSLKNDPELMIARKIADIEMDRARTLFVKRMDQEKKDVL